MSAKCQNRSHIARSLAVSMKTLLLVAAYSTTLLVTHTIQSGLKHYSFGNIVNVKTGFIRNLPVEEEQVSHLS